MNGTEQELPGRCVEARSTIHDLLDGPVPTERIAALDRHLAGCDSCRALRDELAMVQMALRDLSEIPMTDDALEEVWDQTVRADEKVVRFVPRARSWRALATAAALVLVTTIAVWMLQPVAPLGPSDDEVELARAQLEQVLGLTGSAIKKTQNAAVKRVLQGKVSPALQRIPILGSGKADPSARRDESWNGC